MASSSHYHYYHHYHIFHHSNNHYHHHFISHLFSPRKHPDIAPIFLQKLKPTHHRSQGWITRRRNLDYEWSLSTAIGSALSLDRSLILSWEHIRYPVMNPAVGLFPDGDSDGDSVLSGAAVRTSSEAGGWCKYLFILWWWLK